MNTIVGLSKKKIIRKYTRSRFLFKEGSAPKGIYFIISGKVKILKYADKRRHITLYIAKAGDLLAAHSIINEHPLTYSAYTLSVASVCFVPAKEFIQLINTSNKFKLTVMQILCSKIDLLENTLVSRSEKSASERLIDAFKLLSLNYGTDSKKYLRLNLTLDDLAGLIGTSKAYLSKVITELTKKGIINFNKNRLRINDLSLLGLKENPNPFLKINSHF